VFAARASLPPSCSDADQSGSPDHLPLVAGVQLKHDMAQARSSPIVRVNQESFTVLWRVVLDQMLGRLKSLESMMPVQRYLLQLIERVGHRITGDRLQGCSRDPGYGKVHGGIDSPHSPALRRVACRRAESDDGWLPGLGRWQVCAAEHHLLADGLGSLLRLHIGALAHNLPGLGCSGSPSRTKPYTPPSIGHGERSSLRQTAHTTTTC